MFSRWSGGGSTHSQFSRHKAPKQPGIPVRNAPSAGGRIWSLEAQASSSRDAAVSLAVGSEAARTPAACKLAGASHRGGATVSPETKSTRKTAREPS